MTINQSQAPAAKSSTDSSEAVGTLAQAETKTNEMSEAPSRLGPTRLTPAFAGAVTPILV